MGELSIRVGDLHFTAAWEADAPQITTATRTPTGNTLVASYPNRKVFELDSKGKVVWEFQDTLHIFRARRR